MGFVFPSHIVNARNLSLPVTIFGSRYWMTTTLEKTQRMWETRSYRSTYFPSNIIEVTCKSLSKLQILTDDTRSVTGSPEKNIIGKLRVLSWELNNNGWNIYFSSLRISLIRWTGTIHHLLTEFWWMRP